MFSTLRVLPLYLLLSSSLSLFRPFFSLSLPPSLSLSIFSAFVLDSAFNLSPFLTLSVLPDAMPRKRELCLAAWLGVLGCALEERLRVQATSALCYESAHPHTHTHTKKKTRKPPHTRAHAQNPQTN